jgi:O-antigen ligase
MIPDLIGRRASEPPARSSGASRQGRLRIGGAWVAVTAVLAAGVGALTAIKPGVAAAVAGASLLPGALLLIGSQSASPDLNGRQFRWLSYAWIFLLLRPIGDYSQGRSSLAAAAGQANLANVLELAVHAVIGIAAVVALRRNGLARWPPWPVLLLPTLALVSTAWSLAPIITFALAFEMFVIALVATLTTAIFIADHALGRSVVRRFLRVTVLLVAVLCVVGLAVGDAGLGPRAEAGRFRWPGIHPIVASIQIGFAFLVLLFGRREAGFSIPATAGLLALFSVCLYQGQTRTALIGLAVTILVGYWIATRQRPFVPRLAGGAAMAAVVVVLVTQYGGGITNYLYRGEPSQQVASLNGRIPLWEVAVQGIDTPDRWLAGYGSGASRVLFAKTSRFAGEAHSAWIELLLSLGLIGVTVGVGLVLLVGVRLFSAPAEGAILPVLFVYLLAMSPVGSAVVIPGPGPGLGFGMLVLCFAARAAPRREAEKAMHVRSGRVPGRVQPAATA